MLKCDVCGYEGEEEEEIVDFYEIEGKTLCIDCYIERKHMVIETMQEKWWKFLNKYTIKNYPFLFKWVVNRFEYDLKTNYFELEDIRGTIFKGEFSESRFDSILEDFLIDHWACYYDDLIGILRDYGYLIDAEVIRGMKGMVMFLTTIPIEIIVLYGLKQLCKMKDKLRSFEINRIEDKDDELWILKLMRINELGYDWLDYHYSGVVEDGYTDFRGMRFIKDPNIDLIQGEKLAILKEGLNSEGNYEVWTKDGKHIFEYYGIEKVLKWLGKPKRKYVLKQENREDSLVFEYNMGIFVF